MVINVVTVKTMIMWLNINVVKTMINHPQNRNFMGGINHQKLGGLWHCFSHINVMICNFHLIMTTKTDSHTYDVHTTI